MFSIRKMHPDDVVEIHAFHTRSIRQVSAPFYTPEAIEAWLKGRTPQGYLKAQENGESFHVAATPTGRIVGFSGWKDGELCGLYVDPEFMGQGLGTQLLKAAEEEAMARGTPIHHLKASLNGQSFYERHGYHKVADGARTAHGVTIPQIIMEKGP